MIFHLDSRISAVTRDYELVAKVDRCLHDIQKVKCDYLSLADDGCPRSSDFYLKTTMQSNDDLLSAYQVIRQGLKRTEPTN